MTYYNTTHVSGLRLVEYQLAAEHQEDRVLEFARLFPNLKYHAEDIGRYVLPNAPRQSWGRALTNLEQAGLLEKLDEQQLSSWNRPCHLYRLARREPEQSSLFA
jgi:hypothetical protein